MALDSIRSDTRQAFRRLRQAPGFTGLAVLILALGLGANGAIFAVVHGVAFAPLPYRDADQLVMVWSHNRNESVERSPISPANFRDFQDQNETLAALEPMYSFVVPNLFLDGESPNPVEVANVSPGMFALLGRPAAIGRPLQAGDEDLVLLSHGFWQRRYGGDPAVVGREVTISGQPSTIVGVMPADFVFPYRSMLGSSGFMQSRGTDIWRPLLWNASARMVDAAGNPARGVHFLGAVGRVAPGRSLDEVRADLSAIAGRLEVSYPDTNRGWGATVVPLGDQTTGDVRPSLLLLAGGVGLLLLMACTNVAGLVLSRSAGRQRDVAVQTALGASRGRLVQQALLEGGALAATGALAAGLLTVVGVPALVALAPSDALRFDEITISGAVIGYMLASVTATVLLVGAGPGLATSRADPRAALAEGSRGTAGTPARRRLRTAIVAAQIALAVVLTAGTLLLTRSFAEVLRVDPGFNADHLLTVQITLPPAASQDTGARIAYYDELFARLNAVPGVVRSGGTTRLPLGSSLSTTPLDVEGLGLLEAERPEVEIRRAVHDFFGAMGMRMLQGRDFTAADGPDGEAVCVINRVTRDRVFGNDDPIGRRVRFGSTGAWMTIIGVVNSVVHGSLEEDPNPEVYISHRQGPPVSPFLVVRTSGDPAAMGPSIRAAILALDAATPINEMTTMATLRQESVAERRFVLALLALFGGLALVLATVGVYGIMAQSVAERRAEFGIRMALGATPADIVRAVSWHAARPTVLGVGLGLAAVVLASPLLAGQLFGVQATDLTSLAGTVAVLVAASAVAAFVPARRAMRVSPVEAIRDR